MTETSAMHEAWIFPDWPAPRGVHAAVTTRHGPGESMPPYQRFNLGLHCGDDREAVHNNRRAVQHVLNLPSEPRWLRQVHGTTVAELGPLATSSEPEADAAVSRVPGTVLGILTADCLPVLFCAAAGGEIAAAHAGWRGLAAGVLEATLAAMATPATQVHAWLGPCIGAASYEVDAPVRDAFLTVDAEAASAFMSTRPGHWQVDLAMLARQRLRAAGVTCIHGGGFDTFTDTRLYSHRREGRRSGRFASLVSLAATP